jgi:hypothetical protein
MFREIAIHAGGHILMNASPRVHAMFGGFGQQARKQHDPIEQRCRLFTHSQNSESDHDPQSLDDVLEDEALVRLRAEQDSHWIRECDGRRADLSTTLRQSPASASVPAREQSLRIVHYKGAVWEQETGVVYTENAVNQGQVPPAHTQIPEAQHDDFCAAPDNDEDAGGNDMATQTPLAKAADERWDSGLAGYVPFCTSRNTSNSSLHRSGAIRRPRNLLFYRDKPRVVSDMEPVDEPFLDWDAE